MPELGNRNTVEIGCSATAPSIATMIPVSEINLDKGMVPVDTCRRCSRPFGTGGAKRSNTNRDFCIECAQMERSETNAEKKDNSHWVDAAMEQGIPLWEQQPDESVDEFLLWESYRDLWPETRPTVTRVAKELGCSTAYVQKIFNKWSWPTRMQSWIREVSADKTAQLRAAKRAMVEDHIQLGEALRRKMITAVENLDPEDVTPSELVSLLKETQRLEQTSRDALDAVEQATAADIDNMPQGLFEDADQEGLERSNAKGLSVEDMAEVVSILNQAGVLQVNGARVGVRQTQTTEVVAVTDEL